MNKNYTWLKQYLLILTMSITATIIIYSCKKDALAPLKVSLDNKITLKEAKAFFESTILSQSPLTNNAFNHKNNISASDLVKDESINDLLYKEPIWDKAYSKQ